MDRSISYLLAVNMEAVMLIIGAWLLGSWLNENHPVSFNWFVVTFLVSFVVILHSFYVVFMTLTRVEAAQEKNKKT